jgi:hypothetical protein
MKSRAASLAALGELARPQATKWPDNCRCTSHPHTGCGPVTTGCTMNKYSRYSTRIQPPSTSVTNAAVCGHAVQSSRLSIALGAAPVTGTLQDDFSVGSELERYRVKATQSVINGRGGVTSPRRQPATAPCIAGDRIRRKSRLDNGLELSVSFRCSLSMPAGETRAMDIGRPTPRVARLVPMPYRDLACRSRPSLRAAIFATVRIASASALPGYPLPWRSSPKPFRTGT